MVMDMLRSCYITQMRFLTDDPTPHWVTWFFADKNAKPFPYQHRFGSLNWASEKAGGNEIGEVPGASRGWSNGANVLRKRGRKFCGKRDYFADGAPHDAFDLCTDVEGNTDCCETELGSRCSGCWRRIPQDLFLVITSYRPNTLSDYNYLTEGLGQVIKMQRWQDVPRWDSVRVYADGTEDVTFPLFTFECDTQKWSMRGSPIFTPNGFPCFAQTKFPELYIEWSGIQPFLSGGGDWPEPSDEMISCRIGTKPAWFEAGNALPWPDGFWTPNWFLEER